MLFFVTVFLTLMWQVKFVRDRSNEVPLAAPTVPSFTSASQGEGQEDEEAKPRKRSLTDQPPAVGLLLN